jgi:hypothetical protein
MVEAAARPPWENVGYAVEPKTRLDRAGHTATVVGHKILVIAGRKRYEMRCTSLKSRSRRVRLQTPLSRIPIILPSPHQLIREQVAW